MLVLGYINLLPGASNYTAVRAFRVLRPLRAVSRLPKLKVGGDAQMRRAPAPPCPVPPTFTHTCTDNPGPLPHPRPIKTNKTHMPVASKSQMRDGPPGKPGCVPCSLTYPGQAARLKSRRARPCSPHVPSPRPTPRPPAGPGGDLADVAPHALLRDPAVCARLLCIWNRGRPAVCRRAQEQVSADSRACTCTCRGPQCITGMPRGLQRS